MKTRNNRMEHVHGWPEISVDEGFDLFLETFLRNLPPETNPGDEAALRELIHKALGRVHEAWPQFSGDDVSFVRYMAERIDDTQSAERSLRSMAVEDLFLAQCCANKIPEAMAVFEERYFPLVDWLLQKKAVPSSAVADIKQSLREQFFLRPSAPRDLPMVGRYGGRGRLKYWVRVVVNRVVLRMLDKDSREIAIDYEDLERISDPKPHSESKVLDRAHGEYFRDAFGKAIGGLPERDLEILRLKYLNGQSIDVIGERLGVHRTTAARWVNKAQKKLVTNTKKILATELALGPDEVDSIVRIGVLNAHIVLEGLE